MITKNCNMVIKEFKHMKFNFEFHMFTNNAELKIICKGAYISLYNKEIHIVIWNQSEFTICNRPSNK